MVVVNDREVLQELGTEIGMRRDRQRTRGRIEDLDVPEVRASQCHGAIKNRRQQLAQIRRSAQLPGYLVQAPHAPHRQRAVPR
jgi:hypothetical protein